MALTFSRHMQNHHPASSAPPPAPLRMLGDAAVAGVLAVARPLARWGLHRAPEGWRRLAEIGLRYEASKFSLSAFGVDLWSDALPPAAAAAAAVHFTADVAVGSARRVTATTDAGAAPAEVAAAVRDAGAADAPRAADAAVSPEAARAHLLGRLTTFFRGEPVAQLALRHRGACTHTVAKSTIDLALARFDATGTLAELEPHLDAAGGNPPPDDAALRRRTIDGVIRTYNEGDGGDGLDAAAARGQFEGEHRLDRRFTRRLLGAVLVSFEPMPPEPEARFVPPALAACRGMPLSPINVVARLSADGRSADLWLQVHHAAGDGAPVQEMLGRLEQSWGLREPVTFPSPRSFALHVAARPCSPAGTQREVWQTQDFVDFAPLLALRQDLLDRHDVVAGGGITLATLLVWCLAHQPEFAGRKFASTVDIPASGHHPRAMNFLSIRPAEFFGALSRRAAMVAYAHEAARLLVDTRRRASPTCVATDTMALLPPALQVWTLRRNLDRAAETFGTVGLSVLKDAKVFVCPFADFGFDDGFIGVGNMLLPAAGGGQVGAVTVKGPRERIETYPAAIRRAVAQCRDYV